MVLRHWRRCYYHFHRSVNTIISCNMHPSTQLKILPATESLGIQMNTTSASVDISHLWHQFIISWQKWTKHAKTWVCIKKSPALTQTCKESSGFLGILYFWQLKVSVLPQLRPFTIVLKSVLPYTCICSGLSTPINSPTRSFHTCTIQFRGECWFHLNYIL